MLLVPRNFAPSAFTIDKLESALGAPWIGQLFRAENREGLVARTKISCVRKCVILCVCSVARLRVSLSD